MLDYRTYQKNDFVQILGTFSESTYFLLDGTLQMYGAHNQYIGFMKPGSYFSNSSSFNYKSLAYIFSEDISVVGVLKPESVQMLKQAYEKWFAYYQQMSHTKLKILEEYLNQLLLSRNIEVTKEN